MEKLTVYTDGGCSGNPGPGGWAYIIKSGDSEISDSGGLADTTNNRMELTAVIRALERISSEPENREKRIEVHTDSQYVKNGISQWIKNWIRNGWKTAAGKPVKNKELWIELKEISGSMDVEWKWVKGHAGDPLNELCDTMVKKEMSLF